MLSKLKSSLSVICFLGIILLSFLYITKDGQITTEKLLKVQVEGAVNSPGIKEIKLGSIVQDAINKAEGFSESYDSDYVQQKLKLATKLKDGDHIFVPFKKQAELSQNVSQSGKININTADIKQLDVLNGVGEVTAKKIIAARPYLKIEDLLSKKIVSNSVYAKIKDQIEI